MPKPKLPHLYREQTRHDNFVWYVRRGHGPRLRIRADYGTPEFFAEYRAAIEGAPLRDASIKKSTLAWALGKYRDSSSWAGLANATRRQRENIYRGVIKLSGDTSLGDIDESDMRAALERRAAQPHAANNFIKAMRSLFVWALENDLVQTDPTRRVKLLAGPNDELGHHTWTEEECSRFEAHWAVGTQERLAYDVLLYTGLRRGDAVKLGKQHIRSYLEGDRETKQFTIRTEKHRKGKAGELITLPLLDPLADSISATRVGDLTFLVTEHGRPWVKESFGNWFRDVCRAAGCPGSAHGLRKAGAVRVAHAGASEAQLMAMYGWRSAKMAQHYIRTANRERLALGAAHMLLPVHPVNEKLPHLGSGAGLAVKAQKKSGG